jgi:roadblock/LC7 domain-containing protein
LWRVNADGSGAAPVTLDLLIHNKEQVSHRWPEFLPDGKHFLYWAGNFSNSKDDRTSGIHVSSLDGKDQTLILPCHSSFGYDAQHLYYADDQRQLVSVEFDSARAKVTPGRTAVVANTVGYQPSTFWAAFTVGANGTVIYNTGVGAVLSVLTWMDRSGKELGRIGEPAIMANPTLSPDGRRVAVDIADVKANNVDIWLASTTGAGNARFTFDPGEDVVGVWSRDGTLVAYRGIRTEGTTTLIKRANGLEAEKKVASYSSVEDFHPNSWSADDRQILGTHQSQYHTFLELVPVAGGKSVALLNSKSNENNGQIAPDGKWVAYASDESGGWEIYVTSFPGATGKWQVSRGGGKEPRWRGDGREIFYIAPSGMLMSVPVNAETVFATGTPAPLFQIHGRAPISSSDVFTYDVAKDGKRFLVNRYVEPEHVPPLTILLNAGNGSTSP